MSLVTWSAGSAPRKEEQTPVNPYHVLQVRHDATLAELRHNYQRLALWNHPGRPSTFVNETEIQRRALVFELLAISYETLTCHRDHYDSIARGVHRSHRLKGQVYTGGKRMIMCGACQLSYPNHQVDDTPAAALASSSGTVSSSSSGSEDDDEEDNDYEWHCAGTESHGVSSALASSSRSTRGITTTTYDDSTTDEEQLTTRKNVNQLFDDSLTLLLKARGFRPFTDPYDVFDGVFGYPVFPRPRTRQHVRWLLASSTTLGTQRNRNTAALTGETVKKEDGTMVSVMTRILYDRKITRTETSTVDKTTGKRRTRVEVTSEPLVPMEQDVDHRAGCWAITTRPCLMLSSSSPEPSLKDEQDYWTCGSWLPE